MDLTSCIFIAAVVLLLVLFFLIKCSQNIIAKDFIRGKYIIVTGCDTGFGRATAVQLDFLGAQVIATCLTEDGRASLRRVCSSRLRTVLLDISQSCQIEKVYQAVKKIIPQEQGTDLHFNVDDISCQLMDYKILDTLQFPFSLCPKSRGTPLLGVMLVFILSILLCCVQVDNEGWS